ncbi:MAG TPA: hypothetical protein VED40_08680 [Azospirillaceae bacterium]|nr:hypothetical protein [Azospirillaceae bacterium]
MNGLRYMARNSLFHQRYVKEAPRTPDQVQASRDAGLAAVSLQASLAGEDQLFARRKDIKAAFERGEISEEERNSRMGEFQRDLAASAAESGKLPDGRDIGDIVSKALTVNFSTYAKGFTSIALGEDDSPGGRLAAQVELDANNRLGELGTNWAKVENESLARFAAEYDLPGFGRAAPKSILAGVEPAPAVSETALRSVGTAQVQGPVTPAPADAREKDGMAVLAMLQSALDRDAAAGKPAGILETFKRVLDGGAAGTAKRV